MAFRSVGSIGALPPGSMIDFEDGDRRIAVCNVDGTIHAIDGVCPHRNGPLAQGALHGKMVVCPWHAWEFDCVSGECDMNPAIVQRKYEVRVENGQILVDL